MEIRYLENLLFTHIDRLKFDYYFTSLSRSVRVAEWLRAHVKQTRTVLTAHVQISRVHPYALNSVFNQVFNRCGFNS